MLFVDVVVLRYCLGFCGLVFWKAIYISILVYFTSPLCMSQLRLTLWYLFLLDFNKFDNIFNFCLLENRVSFDLFQQNCI